MTPPGTLPSILPVIPTPLRDSRFDEASFVRFLEHVGTAVDGFVLLGSTGEAPSLPLATRQMITERVLAITDPGLSVVVGISTTCQDDTVELARHAQAHGAAGVLCAAPFYFRNSPDGVLRYLSAVDSALEIDLIFYDNPEATKTSVTADDVISWSRILGRLRTVKLTDHDLSKIPAWHQAGLRVYAGDDPIAFRFLRAGVDGVMMIVPAVFPREFRQVWELCRDGRYTEALEIFGRVIAPFSHVFGVGDEIATTKALFADLGIYASAEVLPPLLPTSSERLELLRTSYRLGAPAGWSSQPTRVASPATT